MIRLLVMLVIVWVSIAASAAEAPSPPALEIERITTAVPFPRGLELIDGQLYVLSRGRIREAGGADGAIEDHAGTIWRVDPDVSAPAHEPPPRAVRENGQLLAAPTAPPFRLLDRAADPPTADRATDRPYCTLRFHPATQSFYICAFSGIDRPYPRGERSFSKNHSDAVLRYDLRTRSWHEVERHDAGAEWTYPHHDPAKSPPPHGWLKGPDNCLVVGDWLYVVSKDNSLLVRYDLRPLIADPHSGPPPSEVVLDHRVEVRGLGPREFHGQSMLAVHDGWLYVGYRTSSVILRIPLDERSLPVQPIVADLVARFDPYDPVTHHSADLTDMAFDAQGRLYVVAALPARLYRFSPDPGRVFDAREGREAPWAHLAELTGNPAMKSENVMVDADGRVYVTAGDAYGGGPLGGAVYRLTPE